MTTQSILEVNGLTVRYGGEAASHAVSNISFAIRKGEFVSLVGESGSGKSTTVSTLVGLLPDSAEVASGTVVIDGTDIIGLSEKRLRRHLGSTVGFVPQDPAVALDPVKTVGHQIAEVFRIHEKVSRAGARVRAIEILERVGIDRPEERYAQYPHELSGGMRQRVLIGIALAANPSLIVADEPTSGLDVTVQKTILDELVTLSKDQGVAILLVTHDLGVAHDRSDRILVMQKGKIVEEGSVDEVFRSPRHAYTQQLLAAVPSLHHPPLIKERRPAAETGSAEPAEQAPLLEVDSLTKIFRFPGQRGETRQLHALTEVRMSIGKGRTLGVVGESGSGKSTLARIIANLEQPTSGTVRVGGIDVHGQSRRAQREQRRHVQYVYQNPYSSLDPRFSIERIISEPLKAFGVGSAAERRIRVAELLDRVALPVAVADRTPVELSGGQRQRIAIARALALTPSLLILDEPVSALDVSVQEQVLQLLVELQTELDLTYVFISHDLGVIRLVSDEVVVLERGVVVEAHRTEELFASPRHPYTVRLLEAIPGPDGEDSQYSPREKVVHP